MRIAKRVGALNGEGAMQVYARARELERAGRSIIHMELGEPDFHPAPAVVAAAQAALAAGRDRYCAPLGLPELRTALAEYLARTRGLGASAGNVVVASGCKLVLSLAMQALIEPGDEVLCPEPSFPIYPSLTRALGGRPVYYRLLEENGFQPDLEELARLITPRTRVAILCSPNNPTGTVYRPEALERLAELARAHDLSVVSDEIYARIVYAPGFGSIATLPGMAERTVVIDGFSKSFAMTGWRLGYAVAPPAMVEALEMLIVNSFTCAPEFVQVAAVEALQDAEGHTQRMVDEYARRRGIFAAGLNEIPGWRCRLPEGAFYAWASVARTGLTAEAAQARLLEEAGVAAIPGAAFGPSGADFLRFSFAGTATQLEEALRRIRGTIGI
ncbi:MAG TPA: pyridoxal phosphate-dependent aminotransferase [Terriglobales bacterium]|nr:pyridoxal phosphate-dependent aminotransferase [Terriglobales bacterium]